MRPPILFAFPILIMTLAGCSWSSHDRPLTEKRPVTDEYHGIRVTDDYRWLDDLKDPAVAAWNAMQNAHSRAYLDGIPFLHPLEDRVREIMSKEVPTYSRLVHRGSLFALKSQPPKNQPMIVILPSTGDSAGERVVVDPNLLDLAGTTAIDWFQPSRDGRLVAVCMSENGSEDGSLYVFDVATGRRLGDVVPRVQYPTAGARNRSFSAS